MYVNMAVSVVCVHGANTHYLLLTACIQNQVDNSHPQQPLQYTHTDFVPPNEAQAWAVQSLVSSAMINIEVNVSILGLI